MLLSSNNNCGYSLSVCIYRSFLVSFFPLSLFARLSVPVCHSVFMSVSLTLCLSSCLSVCLSPKHTMCLFADTFLRRTYRSATNCHPFEKCIFLTTQSLCKVRKHSNTRREEAHLREVCSETFTQNAPPILYTHQDYIYIYSHSFNVSMYPMSAY